MRGRLKVNRSFALLLVMALTLGPAAGARAGVVHFKELMAILDLKPPQGWEVAEKPQGTTIKSPVEMSEARVSFKTPGDKQVEVTIIDGVAAGMPYLGQAHQVVEMESSEEYFKSIEVQGFKGWEAFHFNDKRGDLNLNVANRFLVSFRGEQMDNNDMLKTLAGQMNLKKLAELAK